MNPKKELLRKVPQAQQAVFAYAPEQRQQLCKSFPEDSETPELPLRFHQVVTV